MAVDATGRARRRAPGWSVVRVAYTLEQCWHRVPGGHRGCGHRSGPWRCGPSTEVELVGVAGRHLRGAGADVASADLRAFRALGPRRRALRSVASARRARRRAGDGSGRRHPRHDDHPAPRRALVVTVHDLAFLHEPEHFTRRGRLLFRRSLELIRGGADAGAVLVAGDDGRLRRRRHRRGPPAPRAARRPRRARRRPTTSPRCGRATASTAGTCCPSARSSRARTSPACSTPFDGCDDPTRPRRRRAPEAGASSARPARARRTRFLGFVPSADLRPLYAGAAVVCYPSLRGGLRAAGRSRRWPRARRRDVSAGTSTEEAAGGAAVLVDPLDVDDIARGITEALAATTSFAGGSRRPAAVHLGAHGAQLTLGVARRPMTADGPAG